MFHSDIEKIVFTGPESTGKTTEATKTAELTQIPMIEEYAREYLTINGAKYEYIDLLNILGNQCRMENEALEASEQVICDTDWLTIYIWSMEVFGLPVPIPDDLHSRHYILCPPNIPWEPDPLRENPDDRDRLYTIYEKCLEHFQLSYQVLER